MTKIFSASRRRLIGAALMLGAFWAVTPAQAIDVDVAEAFVARSADDLQGLLSRATATQTLENEFLDFIRARTAVAAIGKFAVGRTWREMSDAQKTAFSEAFESYVARTYSSRFNEYHGETIRVIGSVDAGRKGVLVKSMLVRPNAADIEVDWLVNDRGGAPLIVDIVFEGVSLAITLREEFGAMLDKRGGDIDRFIRDLASRAGA